MDPATRVLLSLAVSTLAWWLSSWALRLYVPDLAGGPRTAIVTVCATLVAFPGDWVVEAAFDHAFATGAMLVALGLALGAFAAALRAVRRHEADGTD